MINICVPVLKRYDLLREMVKSCMSSNVRPDTYWVIDNGRNTARIMEELRDFDIQLKLHTPSERLGIAKCWNWFIDRVPEERIIVNDDIRFGPSSIEQLIASKADIVWAKDCGFSCFVLRDACVGKLGRFDESISPNYGYYEDEDYLQRLDGRGTREASAVAEEVDADVAHVKSATLHVASHDELLEHHRLFKLAQSNYAKKWKIEHLFQ